MAEWVYRNGARLTPWMNYQINRLNADFKKRFGYDIIVSSGVRTFEDQRAIFLARYVTYANVRGRRVYDTRWWNGVLWYRISSAGTVAAPNSPQANHQIQGSKGAVDIRDTGPDAGVMTKTSPRGRWIRQEARKYYLVPEGDGFGEGWHFAVLDVWRTPPGSSAGGGAQPIPPTKETTVVPYRRADATARKTGRKLAKGSAFYLHTSLGLPTSKASNIIGGVGSYSVTASVYAEGTPGDELTAVLVVQHDPNGKPVNSRHYSETILIGPSGKVQRSVEWKPEIGRNTAVYARVEASGDNEGEVTVTVFDTNAYLLS
jgi:hypothetical protein